MTLYQERSPNPSLHCSIALKAVVLMEQSLEVFLVPFGYDADERVIERLQALGKTAVIPPKRNRTTPPGLTQR